MSDTANILQHLDRIKAVNHHLRLALDQVNEGVLILEGEPLSPPGPKVIFANEGALRLTGRDRDSLQGCALGELFAGDLVQQVMAVLTQPQTADMAHAGQLIRKGQKPAHCLWRAKAVRDASDKISNITFTFTEEKAIASPQNPAHLGEPPAASDYQGDLIETIRETARHVAHEFNNALLAILGPVSLALRQVPDGDVQAKLQMAQTSTQKAAGLAKDFLDCFRPRLPSKELCNIKELLGRTIRLATLTHHADVAMDAAPDLMSAEVDPEQIDRVIFNLVRNSCQAMPNGGRIAVKASNCLVSPESPVADLPPGPYIVITVRDWGPGIPEEYLTCLFHSRFTTKADGNGCGLPICHQIIREHGGEIIVRSRVNVGSAFSIYLPAVPALTTAQPPAQSSPVSQAPAAAAPPPPIPAPVQEIAPEPPPPPAPPYLLIVDDDTVILTATVGIAEYLGYQVNSAATSDQALDIVRSQMHAGRPIASVVLDINLRDSRDGFQTLQEMHRMDPSLRVVATSGMHGSPEDYRKFGFVHFLAKPYTVEQFETTMREVLAP